MVFMCFLKCWLFFGQKELRNLEKNDRRMESVGVCAMLNDGKEVKLNFQSNLIKINSLAYLL